MKTKTNQLVSHIVTNECINIETIEDITTETILLEEVHKNKKLT